MRTLVTGATGFIGRALAAQLATEGENELAILVRDRYRSRPLPETLHHLSDRIIVLYADLRDYHETRRAVQAVRPDVIYHLAAGGVSEPFLAVDVALEQNLSTMLNLLRAAFDDQKTGAQPQQLIAVRTPGEKSVMNPYAASKAAAWQFCAMYARTRGWPIVGAMPYQTYGPGQDSRYLVSGALSAAEDGEDFELTAGTQARDWIYVSDVANGLLAVRDAGLAPGMNVELGTGRLTSVGDVVQMVYDLVGGNGRPVVDALPLRAGEEQMQVADVDRAKALTGWQAALSLEQGISRTYDLLRRRRA